MTSLAKLSYFNILLRILDATETRLKQCILLVKSRALCHERKKKRKKRELVVLLLLTQIKDVHVV